MIKSKYLLLLIPVFTIFLTGCPDSNDPFGKLVYVTSSQGLRIVDVTDPEAPIEVGLTSMPNGANDVKVVSDYAYVTDYYNKIINVIKIKDEKSPEIVGSLTLTDRPNAIAVQDYYAYVTVEKGVRIIDISDPEKPGEVKWNKYHR